MKIASVFLLESLLLIFIDNYCEYNTIFHFCVVSGF